LQKENDNLKSEVQAWSQKYQKLVAGDTGKPACLILI